MKTFTRVALLATTAVLLSGCASMPKYLAWLKPGREKPAVEIQPVRSSTETASVAPADRLYSSAVAAWAASSGVICTDEKLASASSF